MDTPVHDVLIVGGGGAGLRAAIAIAETSPELSVAVASKLYPMRSHTVSAEGGAAAVIKDNDSFEDHCYDTISGADWLADQDAVEAFVDEAPRELTQLEHWGCPWSRRPDGTVNVRPFGGMKIERTWFAADKTGFHMLHTLYQTSLKYEGRIKCATTSGSYTKLHGRRTIVAGASWRSRCKHRSQVHTPGGAQGGDHVHRRRRTGFRIHHQRVPSRPATAWRWRTAKACR